MERIDNSKFLLYIEPNSKYKSEIPVNDELTGIMTLALSEAQFGCSNYNRVNAKETFMGKYGYKGIHITDCGKCSDNYDYLLKNGMITNSLCVFYLQYYREVIPQSELDKVKNLLNYYKNGNC